MQCLLVSVIISGYNHVSFLKERIDSVLYQDYFVTGRFNHCLMQ